MARSRSHTHNGYVAVIIAQLILVGILAGALITGIGSNGILRSPSQQRAFTHVHGVAGIGTNLGSPLAIYFSANDAGTLSTTISGETHSYELYLISDKNYSVAVYYQNEQGGIVKCDGLPSPFNPSGDDRLQNFNC